MRDVKPPCRFIINGFVRRPIIRKNFMYYIYRILRRALGFFILLLLDFGGESVRALPFYYFEVPLSRENLTLFYSRKVQKGIDFSLFRDIM